MRIYQPALQLEDTEGFSENKDLFSRKALGDGMTNLVAAVDHSLVIAVDGPWGCGKTTFLRMWAGELRKSSFPVVYFDAFEHDYFEDPFMAVASEIIALAKKADRLKSRQGRKFLDKAKGVGKVLLRSGLKVGTSLATAGIVEYETAEKAAKEVAAETSSLVDKYLGEMLTKAAEQRDTIAEFKAALSDLPSLLSADAENTKPLIFIIDELDRCRPSFALQTLERIKHFFSVPHVHFVLGAHVDQLRHSAKVMYGPDLDATLYLQKFINLAVPLVDTSEHERERVSSKFVAHLFRGLQLGIDRDDIKTMSDMLADVAHKKHFSLRTIEQIVGVLAIALATNPNLLRLPTILIGLCIMKITEPQLYLKSKDGRLTLDEATGALGLDENNWGWDWWRFCLDPTLDEEIVKQLYGALFRYGVRDRLRLVAFTANGIIDSFKLELPEHGAKQK